MHFAAAVVASSFLNIFLFWLSSTELITTTTKHVNKKTNLGATRGIGKGVALQLGERGATVYITGRTLKSPNDQGPSLEETAKEVEKR